MEDGRTGESQSLPKAFLFQEVLPCFLYNSVFVSIMEHLHWPAFSIKPHYDPPGSAETLQGDSDDLFLHLWFLCGKLSPSKCCLSQQTLAPFGLALVCLSLPSTWAPGLWLTG